MKTFSLKLEENILASLSLIMTWGALIYYFYELNWLGIIITLALSSVTLYFKIKIDTKNQKSNENTDSPLPQRSFYNLWPILVYLILIIISFFILIKSSSSKALISPWLVTPISFFWAYGLTTAWLFFTITRNLKQNYKLWLLRIHYFLALSIALVIYKIGYGFDPFIHQATMELIDKKGYVDPKPLYYLGQYSLIVIFHKLSGVSIYLLNKILVPTLTALFLPSAIFSFIKKYGEIKRAPIVILALLALPLNLFILSTPQNLTYLWLLILIFYSLAKKETLFLSLLAIATLSIHPLGGLPAIIFVIWLEIIKIKDKIKTTWWKIINIFLWVISALSLPVSFTLVTGQSWRDLSLSFTKLSTIFKLDHSSTNIGDFSLNFLYLLSNNWLFIFIILIITGFIIWFRINKNTAYLFIKIISALAIGFLLSASLSFSFLIDYERDNYISRLPILMALYGLPAIILSIDYLTTRIWRSSRTVQNGAWVIIIIFCIASLYLSYPRLDAYTNSRGYSVSKADLETVTSIDNQTKNPYIVLANQQTSVASIKELGFDHYFTTKEGQIFFYPIPTGGQLYQYYLRMVNENPDKEIMRQAMDFVGVKESYFVISKYWWLSNRIIAEAKINADTYWEINGGEVYVFRFNY